MQVEELVRQLIPHDPTYVSRENVWG